MREQTYIDVYTHELHHWWYRVRRKLVGLLIEQYAHKKDQKINILDVGCGTGGLMKELVHVGNTTGVDMSEGAVMFCKKRGIDNVLVGDIQQLPFENSTFDVVVALDILEHVDDDLHAIREVFRVLKPDGIAIIFVPALMLLWGATDEAGQHKRRYTKKRINTRLEAGGLHVLRSTYFNTLLFLPILFVRLMARFSNHSVVDEFRPGKNVMNKILYHIFSLELFMLRYVSFPVGVSILSVCKKNAVKL